MHPRPYLYLVALFCLPLALPTSVQSAEPAPELRHDVGKGRIEIPLKLALAAGTAPAAKEAPLPAAGAPLTAKKLIENSAKLLVAKTQPAAARPTIAAAKPALEKAPVKNLDRRKNVIEAPIEKLIAGEAAPKAPASGVAVEPPRANPPSAQLSKTKAIIEAPAKTVVRIASPLADKATVATSTAPAAAHPQLTAKVDTSSNEDNPRVEPGKVRWHDDFAAACSASRDSGKPVLLFHLMGRLDQRFT